MIRFYCSCCGRSNESDDSQQGGEMTCTHCGKTTYIPYNNEYGKIVPDEELCKRNREKPKHTFQKRILTSLLRDVRFDELSLFVIAFSVVLLLLCSPLMRQQIRHHTFQAWQEITEDSPGGYILFGFLVIVGVLPVFMGVYVSIVHVFTDRLKTSWEKYFMYAMAFGMTVLAGVVSGYYLLINAFMSPWWWLWIIGPIWNWMNLLWFMNKIDMQIKDRHESVEEIILDNDATAIEVVVSAIVIVIWVLMGQFVFKLHWSLIYSMCVVYATNFCKSWRHIFVLSEDSEQDEN